MIPWWSVFFNSLWILGLAILLADLGFHYWLVQVEGNGLREQFRRSQFQKAAWLGLIFFGAGLAGTGDRAWETALWTLLTLYCLVNLVRLLRNDH
jgi:hypothetical protein